MRGRKNDAKAQAIKQKPNGIGHLEEINQS